MAKINGIFKRKYALDELVCGHLNCEWKACECYGKGISITKAVGRE